MSEQEPKPRVVVDHTPGSYAYAAAEWKHAAEVAKKRLDEAERDNIELSKRNHQLFTQVNALEAQLAESNAKKALADERAFEGEQHALEAEAQLAEEKRRREAAESCEHRHYRNIQGGWLWCRDCGSLKVNDWEHPALNREQSDAHE